MSTSDYKSQDHTSRTGEHGRRESDLSGPVSDYEYFQFSPAVQREPVMPITPSASAPPLYTGAQSPTSLRPSSPASQAVLGPFSTVRSHSTLPEVVPEAQSPIPEVPEYQLTPDHGEKEFFRPPKTYHNQEIPATSRFTEAQEDPIALTDERRSKKYLCGLSKRGFIIAVVALIIVIIAIAVGVGVGVGVGRHKKSSPGKGKDPTVTIGGAYDPKYFSHSGAFNGSGVALADVNFGLDNSLYVFYQRYSGEIEQIIYESDGSWAFVTQVATNAKNSTPLSTVAYIVNSVATWHLFYVSEDNYLKQRTQTNASQFQTNIWEDGPINDLNLKVNDADTVGMQACYWGNYYGSLTDYDGAQFESSNATATIGMNIWYADTDTSFQQYDWTNGQSQWNHTQSWPNQNGHAGVGCQSWLSNTTSYVFMADSSNTMRIYWKDIDTNKTATDIHPISQYTMVEDFSIPDLHPSSSLGYTDFVIYQTLDGTVHGANVTWAAENTTVAPAKVSTQNAAEADNSGKDEWALQPQDAAIGGTHMAITGSTPASGGQQELLFYQQEGDDLRLGKRDADGGDFSFIETPLDTLKSA